MPKILVLTRSAVMEKFKVNGSVARGLLKVLADSGKIKPVGDVTRCDFSLYTGTQAKSALEKKAEEEAAADKKKK